MAFPASTLRRIGVGEADVRRWRLLAIDTIRDIDIRWGRIFRALGWYTLAIVLGLFMGFCAAVLPIRMMEVPLGIIAIILGLVLWGIRHVKRVPLRPARMIFLAFVVCFCTLPLYLAISLPGFPWISIHRVLLAILVLMLAMCVSGSHEVRVAIGEIYVHNKTLFRLITAMFLSFFASVPFSEVPMLSFSETAQGLLQWFIPFAACLLFVRTEDETEAFVRLLIICLLITVGDAVAEYQVQDKLFVKLLPHSFFENNPIYQDTFSARTRDGMYRASANFSLSLSFAEFCSMISPFCLHFMINAKRREDRILGGLGYVAVVIGLVLAHARGGVIGFLVSSVSYGLLYSILKLRRDRGSIIGPLLLSFFSLGVMMIPLAIMVSHTAAKMVFGGADSQSSTDSRFEQWRLAVPHILSNPVFGHGVGHGAELVGWTASGAYFSLDSYVITLLVETGVVGLLVFALLLFHIIARSGPTYLKGDQRAAIMAPICAALCGFTINRLVLSQFENHTTLYMLAAMCATASWRLKTPPDKVYSVLSIEQGLAPGQSGEKRVKRFR